MSEPLVEAAGRLDPPRGYFRAWGGFLVAVTVAVVVVAVWLGRREDAQTLRTWEGRMTGSARTQARAVSSWVAERSADAASVVENPQFQSWARSGADQAPMAAWLSSMRTAFGYRAIVVTSGRRELMIGDVDDSMDSVLRERMVPPAGRVSFDVVELTGGVARILVHLAARSPPGASVILVVDPQSSLFEIVQGAAYGTETGEVSLVVRRGGSIEFFSPLPDADAGASFVRIPEGRADLAAAVALDGVTGFGRYRNYRGTPVFAATYRDSITGWGLVRRVHAAEVMRPARRAQVVIGVLSLLVVLVSGLASRAMWQRDRRRVLDAQLNQRNHDLAQLQLRAQAVEVEAHAGRLARLLDDAGEEIYVFNADTYIVELANRRAVESLGYDMASLCRRTPLDLAPQLQPEEFHAALKELLEGREPTWLVETEHQRRDGSRYPVALTVRYSTAETPPVFIALATDITNRRSLEAMLRQSQKMEAIGRLAGGVAHDFNNILTVIHGSGELALSVMGEDDPAREDVAEMLAASLRAAALTSQLLAFSRRQIIKPEVVALNGIVTGVRTMLARLLGEDVDLVLNLTAERDLVLVDAGQIEQVIMNLAVNARDAMPHGGRMTIETGIIDLTQEYASAHITTKPGPHVMLAVSDTGSGMDAETRARIFEPFYTTKPKGSGTGLGLATVFGLVKQSGGNIWVYSEPGQGSTFKVYFPAAVPGAVPAPLEPLPLDTAVRGSETVLVVEDDDAIRRIAARVLTANGYTVLQAGNGEEALALAQASDGNIHLLLTDVVMPRMGGRALAERLAVRRPRTRVLYMSGFTDNAIVHHNVLERGLDFLQKPFTPVSLLAAVRTALDRT